MVRKVQLRRLAINNFRAIEAVDIAFDGSRVFIGPNGAGKSSVLKGLAMALGRDRSISPADFRDPHAPIEVVAELTSLDDAVLAEFADEVSVVPGQGATLQIGARAVIDGSAVDVRVGFPPDWRSVSRRALDALPVLSVEANRDALRLLDPAKRGGLLAEAIETLDLAQELQAAGDVVHEATASLASAEPMAHLLQDLSGQFRSVLAAAPEEALALEGLPAGDLMRLLELHAHYQGFPQPLRQQPSGLRQLAVFSLILEQLRRVPGTLLLVDELETSLPPQTVRALTGRLLGGASQVIAATHSADVLTRWDVRSISRLSRAGAQTAIHDVSGISDAEAAALERYSTNGLSEAFFATTAILVEGPGDRLALKVFASSAGIDLDARGISIVELAGADLFPSMLKALGPGGLGIQILGLCDQDRERRWGRAVGVEVVRPDDRAALETAGVFVCVRDIEDVLFSALGEQRIRLALQDAGLDGDYERFAQQPDKRSLPSDACLMKYLRHDTNKTTLPPLLAAAHAPGDTPPVVRRLLERV